MVIDLLTVIIISIIYLNLSSILLSFGLKIHQLIIILAEVNLFELKFIFIFTFYILMPPCKIIKNFKVYFLFHKYCY
jgi:hypothetical protein